MEPAEEEAYPNQRIFERDRFTCQYCGWRGDQDFDRWFVAHLQVGYLLPPSEGGTEDDANRVTCCHACRSYKADYPSRTLEEARQYVLARRRQVERWYDRFVLKTPS